MNQKQLQRLNTVIKLNEHFCKGALEVSKNLCLRNVKDRWQLDDIKPIDYLKDRCDINLFQTSGDFVFVLDVENHKVKTLKGMIL